MIVSEVLEHIWDDERALVEIVRVLRPGGRVAATVPTRWPERVSWALNYRYHDTPGGHVRIYRQHELEAEARTRGPVPARFAPLTRVPLAVLVAEVRVRARQHRSRARPQVPRLLVPSDRAQPALGATGRASVEPGARQEPRRLRRESAFHDGEMGKAKPCLTLNFPWLRASCRAPRSRRRSTRSRRCNSPTATSRGFRADRPTRGTSSRRRWRSTSAAATPRRSARTTGSSACNASTARGTRTTQGDAVKERALDTNVTSYIANGVWHHYLCTGDTGFLEVLFPIVERAHRLRARPPARRRVRSSGTPIPTRTDGQRRAAHRLVEHLLVAAVRDRGRRTTRPRPPRLGVVARLARHRHRAPARAVPRQGTLGDGLVLPDPRRRAARPRGRSSARIASGTRSSHPAAACVASPTSRGSPRPRRANS